MEILPKIKSPKDLAGLSLKEIETLADELRDKIVTVVASNGGHLSPNLGAVELTIALHRVFDFSRDKIIWDVGHQCYSHKLITGRYDRFDTLRREGGISGFPSRDESPYDHFNTGHAGTSISAALGMATARDLKGEDYKVVAFIGDGAMSSGLALEGLNNAGAQKTDLTVILNDNEMSIDENVGALSTHLNRIISGEWYNSIKDEVGELLSGIPGIGEQVKSLASRIDHAVKGMFVPGKLFEDLGFKYYGPVDGHNLPVLLETLDNVKKLKGPRIIHVVTRKGKGYVHAEEKSDSFHGTPPFIISTGKKKSATKATYTSIFGKTMVELAENDEKILAITAAMRDGTGLVEFAEKYPERAFDVGIAEQHAVTMAAGMATEGFKPVVAIYSSFLQRSFDQILHDVCIMNLPVTFAIDRAGIVGDDGLSHQGVFDISYLRQIPNMTVMAPKDENELRHMIHTAVNLGSPCAVRYPRGIAVGVPLEQTYKTLKTGKAELIREGNDLLICAIGDRVHEADKAAARLEREGYSVAVINARFIKPMDADLIASWARRCRRVLTVEENALMGGFGSAVFEELRKAGLGEVNGASLGVPDRFVEQATQESSRKRFGIDAEGIYHKASELLHLPEEVKTILGKDKKTVPANKQ